MKTNIIAIIAAIGFIIGGLIIERGYNYKFKSRNTISVAGSAYYNFTADLIVWSASFERTSMDIKDAYTHLKEDEHQIQAYMLAHGIDQKEVIFSSIVSEKLSQSNGGDFSNAMFELFNLSRK